MTSYGLGRACKLARTARVSRIQQHAPCCACICSLAKCVPGAVCTRDSGDRELVVGQSGHGGHDAGIGKGWALHRGRDGAKPPA